MYVVQIPDDDLGNTYQQNTVVDDGGGNYGNYDESDEDGDTYNDDHDSGSDLDEGGGGTGGAGDTDDEKNKFEDPDPGAGNGEGSNKAAVYVQVVDEETGVTIKKKGIEFELYGSGSALQVLSTYYPKKTDYKKYQTDESGVFYLPEKLYLASY